MSGASPLWFDTALATEATEGETVVDGARISFRSWGEPGGGLPDVLLVHGGAANARWWDHLAPLLASNRCVTAIDLSGHGDSDHRPAYTLDGWADELVAVIRAARLNSGPILVGHSLGGLVATGLAARGAPTLGGLIVVDSPIDANGPAWRGEADAPVLGTGRVHSSTTSPIDRFHPIPDQPTIPYIAAHIAESSVRHVEGGWSWKFDPRFVTMSGEAPRTLDGLPCRVVLIAAERGLVPDATRSAMKLSASVAVLEIPDAGHAIMLDQPLALLSAIRGVLVGWSETVPAAPGIDEGPAAG